MRSIIANYDTFDYYVQNFLPDLIDDEVYFLSLSARNKYLTEEERKTLSLGRTEMFSRVIVRDKLSFDKAIRQLTANWSARRTKNNMLVPQKCLVCYININPVSTIDATNRFFSEFSKANNELMTSLIHKKQSNFDWFRFADRKYQNCLQQSTSRKVLIDFDIDTKDFSVVYSLTNILQQRGVFYFIVKTHGGYHVLVERKSLNETKSGKELFATFELLKKQHSNTEIMINKNGMIPLPGSYQAGTEVSLIF